jgi:hypothetical protein
MFADSAVVKGGVEFPADEDPPTSDTHSTLGRRAVLSTRVFSPDTGMYKYTPILHDC